MPNSKASEIEVASRLLSASVTIRRLAAESICIASRCGEPDCPITSSQREEGLDGVTRRMNEIRELADLATKE